jgi:hypothetical protein
LNAVGDGGMARGNDSSDNLTALATVMADPITNLSKLRQSRAFDPQFDRVLEQDPIFNANAHVRRHLI